MGFEARYQALPEGAFLARARVEAAFAESIQFLHDAPWRGGGREDWHAAAQDLLAQHPGLPARHFYGRSRQFDAIHYLLSERRRTPDAGRSDDDPHSVARAIYGLTRLHPTAATTQGFPIGLVPAAEVPAMARYLAGITRDALKAPYDPRRMSEAAVYKIAGLDAIWEELQGMRVVYEAAARHGEAMVTMRD